MTEITRKRQTHRAPIGQTQLVGVPEGLEALATAQLQENIEALADQNHKNAVEIDALKTLLDGLDIPDDATGRVKKLARRVEELEDEVRKIWDKLRNMGPFVKYWTAPTEADLEDIELPNYRGLVRETNLGFDESTNTWYKRNSDNDGWEKFATGGFFSEADFAALDALTGLINGDRGYTEDKNNLYGRRAGAWHILHPFEQTTAPSSIGEADGDLWYDTDDDRPAMYVDGAWRGIAYAKSDGKLYYWDGSSAKLVSHWA